MWSAIVRQIDLPGSQSEFVSVGDSPRELFHKHPWSIGGGGAAELKEQSRRKSSSQVSEASRRLDRHYFGDRVRTTSTCLIQQRLHAGRHSSAFSSSTVVGEIVRDWTMSEFESGCLSV